MTRFARVKLSLLEDWQTLIEGLYAQQAMTDWGGVSSYNVLNAIIEESRAGEYDPEHGDDKRCSSATCNHTYDRHFDSWDNMRPVGCKYCPCSEFQDRDWLTDEEQEA